MSDSVVSHVSIAVKDLDEAVKRFELLTGGAPELIKDVPDQKVKVAIFSGSGGDAHGGGNIELVTPSSPDSPVSKFLEKKGEGLHHICIFVDDIESKLEQLKAEGARLIDESPRIGAEGNKIAFVHPSSVNGVLLELEERPK